MVRSQPLEIELFGSAEASTAFRAFTGPHKRLPFVRSKTFGAALQPIPADPNEAFRGTAFRNLRQRRNRALDYGYTFTEIDPTEQVERILAINRSATIRQGKPLTPAYTDSVQVRRYCSNRRPFFGIVDQHKILRAYCHLPVLGQVFNFARILGEHDHLKHGIMYLLVWEAITIMGERQRRFGYPDWAMYDMYIGGGQGLRIFKKECGFRPYRVIWRWNQNRGHADG